MGIPYPLREMTNREIRATLVSQCNIGSFISAVFVYVSAQCV